jgi:hypothetical protein
LVDFTNRSFLVVYDYLYDHVTTNAEINGIRSGCTASSMLCVGGSDTEDRSMLLLVACGDCLQITQTTVRNSSVLHKGVYWYYTPGASFGFAPNSLIKQGTADTEDENANKRLSWDLGGSGGWRIGSSINLNDSVKYRKIILKHD